MVCKYIATHKNCKDNLILPRIHSDVLKFSFSTVPIKILNCYMLENISLTKEEFKSALKDSILQDIYEETSKFFS